jgi:RNA polymerase sigma factor (sigma-70 family)
MLAARRDRPTPVEFESEREKVTLVTTKSSSTDSDRRLDGLMRATQAGDARAYAMLLEEVTPRLRRIIWRQRRYLKREDIEDLVQDVLLSLHAVRATYDPKLPFVPWFRAIIRNRLADGARRHMRHAAHEVQVEKFPVTFSDDGPNSAIGEYRDPQALVRAVRGLPAGQRRAIELVKLREMSLKEAAAATGTSIAALKVSIHRAMVSLRKIMTKD